MITTPDITQNETLKTIRDRRSVRLFTEQPVPEMHLLTILAAANRAPVFI